MRSKASTSTARSNSAEALLTVINDVLDLSRVDAGQLALAPVDVDLASFLDRLRLQVEPRASARQIEFRSELQHGAPRQIRVDPGRLRQVLLNLIGNALKFTASGHILLRVAPGRSPPGRLGLTIEVEDTGLGIPPAALQRLFGSFAQAEPDTARLFGGSGLGLMIAQRLTWRWAARSRWPAGPGRGPSFASSLPSSRQPSIGRGSRPLPAAGS